MDCKYRQSEQCLLLTILNNIHYSVPKSFCQACQIKGMLYTLNRIGVDFAGLLPDNPDDLKKAIADGKVQSKKYETSRQQAESVAAEYEEKIQAALAELPSWFQMAKNLRKHAIEIAKHYKETGRIKCDGKEVERRLNICSKCDKYIKDKQRCSVCGCHLKNVPLLGEEGKATFEALTCKYWEL